jgi:hypothetical protein
MFIAERRLCTMHLINDNNYRISLRVLWEYGLWKSYAYVKAIIHVGFEVLTAVVMKSTILLDTTPCSSLKVNRRFWGTHRALLCSPPAFTMVSCLAYCSALNMGAICSSETSVDFHRTTRRYIPEDSTLRYYPCWCKILNSKPRTVSPHLDILPTWSLNSVIFGFPL